MATIASSPRCGREPWAARKRQGPIVLELHADVAGFVYHPGVEGLAVVVGLDQGQQAATGTGRRLWISADRAKAARQGQAAGGMKLPSAGGLEAELDQARRYEQGRIGGSRVGGQVGRHHAHGAFRVDINFL